MDIDSSLSADSLMGEQSASSSAAAEGINKSPRLQQKIDVVQQVVTLLELTMASGKCSYENKVSSMQKAIEHLQRSIDEFKNKIIQTEGDFSLFSNIVGGGINKFCALDNILRTVEESRTENDDVKILLPDVSVIDVYVQSHASNRSQEWAKIKEEILRLNSESQKENQVVRCIRLKVTIKNRILNGPQSERVNEIAAIINGSRGKSLNRFYRRNEVPEYSDKYLKIPFNKQNIIASEAEINDIIEIAHRAFSEEGEVVKIIVLSGETIPAVNEFQDASVQPSSQSSQGMEMRICKPFAQRNVEVYHVGETAEATQTPESHITTLNLKDVNPANANEDIQIVREVTGSSRIRLTAIGADTNVSTSRITPIINTNTQTNQILPVENEIPKLPKSFMLGRTMCQSLISNSANNPNLLLSLIPINNSTEGIHSTYHATSATDDLSLPNNLSKRVSVITNVSQSENIVVDQSNVTPMVESSSNDLISRKNVLEPGMENSNSTSFNSAVPKQSLLKTIEKSNIDASKAADRFASSEIRKLLAVTLLTLPRKKHQPANQSNSAPTLFEKENLSKNVDAVKVSTEVSSSVPSSISTSSVSIPIQIKIGNDHPVAQSCSSQPNNQDENETDECLEGVRLKKRLIQECVKNGVCSLRDFQKELLPILIDGRDVFCKADRNSGKSTSLVLSALQKVNPDILAPQILVATASFSCTEKIAETFDNFGKPLMVICRNADELTASSSSSLSYMQFSKKPKSHVLVGVPTSLLQLLMAQKFQNQTVNCLMLDDLDIMLSQGLKSTIIKMVYALNASTQVVVMASSLTNNVEEFRKNFTNPVNVIQPEVIRVVSQFQEHSHKQIKDVKSSLFNNETSLNLRAMEGNYDNTARNDSEMENEYEQETIESSSLSPSPPSSDDIIALDDDVFSSENESSGNGIESDGESCVSDSSELDTDMHSISISRRSSEEIETMICANEIFDGDDKIMTVIPEYIYQSLGIPMISNSNSTEDDEVREGASHFYVVLNEDCLKIETLSLLDIEDEKTIIFCNTIEKVEWLSSRLRQRKLWPQTIHEDMDRSEWSINVRNFAQGQLCKLIIATDFMTELTTQGASLVINYDFPNPHRNYLSRAAFAERCIGQPACDSDSHPTVISFITKSNLTDIKDLKNAFNLRVQPMSNNS